MARKTAAGSSGTQTPRKRVARKRSTPRISSQGSAAPAAMPSMRSMQGLGDMSKMAGMAKMMTPEQAIELYKANAALALEVINTAIESTARLRKKQF